MQTLRYEFVLEAESPVAHHGETFGNQALVMRRKTRQPDGTFASVPVITADTMRHGLRESAAMMFLDAAGLLGDAESGMLSRSALRLLFNGGMVTGRGDASVINLNRYREMVELCPPLALLGGCCDSRVIPGRMSVEDARLCCHEQESFIPEWAVAVGAPITTMREHVEESTRVRMDPLLDPAKRKLLTTDEQIAVNNLLESGEAAHESDDAVERSESKSSMLPRTFESVVQGSRFYWALSCNATGELDVDTLHVMLAAFLYRTQVGGKKGTGHGYLRCLSARQLNVLRPSERSETVDLLGQPCGVLFRSHVASRAEQIKSWLSKVDA